MSRLAQRLRGGRSATLVTGTLSGSSSLSIPQGVTLVSLTGRGGDGGNNSWYDAGQPYIADTRTYAWDGGVEPGGPVDYLINLSGWAHSKPAASGSPSAAGQTQGYSWSTDGGGGHWWAYSGFYSSYQTGGSAGQAYIAPTSGGGPYSGTSSTATLNSVTDTWAGGYDSGGVGATSTQTLASTGAGQTLTYSIPGTGTLTYSYEI